MRTARFLFLRRSSGEQIGNPPFLQPINAMVFAEDILFRRSGGQEEGLTFAPGGERYLTPSISDIPGGGTGEISVVDLAASNRFPFPINSGDLGILMFTNASRGSKAG